LKLITAFLKIYIFKKNEYFQVIQETLRSASILSFTFREAVEDVELEGYLIPKGWKVLPLFRTIHHSAEFFPRPEKFDPSRFEVPTKNIQG
jgi:(+)-abscisic acid 8'-hydroxylase